MYDLKLTESSFDSLPNWTIPIDAKGPLIPVHNDLFDQNGYDLTLVEELYAARNYSSVYSHRYRKAIRKPWFIQPSNREGAVLNHALLFERKGFAGKAREQLQEWAKIYPSYHKHLNQRPKWGLDFSMDYYDSAGNTFEVLHWEFDSFDYNEIIDKKSEAEWRLSRIDWETSAKELLKRKDEWYNLDFFAQSDYKCHYFGIGSERWKMVVWS